MPSKLDTRISQCSSWDDFVELLNTLPKGQTKDKGDLFERLTQVYLQTHPTYRSKLKNVYLLSDKTIPERLRTKLNLPDNDEGIDLVCETYSGEYWSVQCKYKSNQSAALTYKELSTFNSLSFNACKGISLGLVAHTSTKPVKKSHLMPMVTEIGLEKWLEISDADWKQIISVCRSNTLKPPKKRKPRRHQKAAISDAHNHFVTKKQKRGKLIMPCGTGKSLTAYWIAQVLEAKTIVVAVPSLALVRQSLVDWTAEYLAEGVIPEWLAVCSDHSVGSMGDADSTVATAYEMGIPTNPSDEELDNFLKKHSKAPKIVFTTYQSAEKLCDASRRNNKVFDLLIADEAHKTVGRKSKSFATMLFDENIKIKRRLFMTATERVYNASRDDVVSMDDRDIYGSTCHQLSFKEAIKQKIICDYKIVTIAVSDTEIDALVKDKAELAVSAGNKTIETDAHSLAAGIAMQKAFKKYSIKHAITFHSSIKRAESFKDQQEDLPNNAHISHSHISSRLSAGQRAKLLKVFAEEERSLITNARCLTEGVDIKAIDCVAFVDPKQSTVDIVQAAGRAMRLSPQTGKVFGYIILPVKISQGEELKNLESNESFKNIAKIVASLSTQDERIAEELRNVSENKQRNRDRTVNFSLAEDATSLVDFSSLENNISTIIWSKIGKANWRNFEEARIFTHSLKLQRYEDWQEFRKSPRRPPDIPGNPDKTYKGMGWQGYADWLGKKVNARRTRAFHKNYLPFEEARKIVRGKKLRNVSEWQKFSEGKDFPSELPKNPAAFYKKSGWCGYGDWLGRDIVPAHMKKKKVRPFSEARKYVRQLGLSSFADWDKFAKSASFPSDIPKQPWYGYADDGYVDLADWLNTRRRVWKLKGKLSPACKTYNQAKEFIKGKKLKSYTEWVGYTKSADFPNDIPPMPWKVYDEWTSLDDWLSREHSRYQNRSITKFSYAEAKEIAKTLGIKSSSDWMKTLSVNREKIPPKMPVNPRKFYEKRGWISWDDFLGREPLLLAKGGEAMPFDEAKNLIKQQKITTEKEFRAWAKTKKRPENFPSSPDRTYKEKGWRNWPDFLGKEK